MQLSLLLLNRFASEDETKPSKWLALLIHILEVSHSVHLPEAAIVPEMFHDFFPIPRGKHRESILKCRI